MADDERRAEIEAARDGLQRILDMSCPFDRESDPLADAQRIASETITKLNQLDRVRDARSDDEAGVKVYARAPQDDDAEKMDALGLYLERYPPSGFADRYSANRWRHIARGVLSAAAIFFAARSPQGEDHEAGLPEPQSVTDYKDMVLNAEAERAALRAFLGGGHMHPANERALLVKLHRAIAAYLSRVFPSRDGSVADLHDDAGGRFEAGYVMAVEDVRAQLDEMDLHVERGHRFEAGYVMAVNELREFLAAFSPASTGDQGPKEENDERRP